MEPSPTSPDDPASLIGMKVLLVEDVPAIRNLVATLLQRLGCAKTYMAGDIDTAVAMTDEFELDAVLLDYNLKGDNGFQFARILRRSKSERMANLPIIVLTAHADEHVFDAARASGADDYLVKPVMPKELGQRIRRAVMNRGGLPGSSEVEWDRKTG